MSNKKHLKKGGEKSDCTKRTEKRNHFYDLRIFAGHYNIVLLRLNAIGSTQHNQNVMERAFRCSSLTCKEKAIMAQMWKGAFARVSFKGLEDYLDDHLECGIEFDEWCM